MTLQPTHLLEIGFALKANRLVASHSRLKNDRFKIGKSLVHETNINRLLPSETTGKKKGVATKPRGYLDEQLSFPAAGVSSYLKHVSGPKRHMPIENGKVAEKRLDVDAGQELSGRLVRPKERREAFCVLHVDPHEKSSTY